MSKNEVEETEDPCELDVDLNDCRGNEWVDFCAKQLGEEKGIKHMRSNLEIWKKKGGPGGTPGNYEALLEKMKEILGAEKEEDIEPITDLLEGTEDDDFQNFSVSCFNSASEDVKLNFMVMLNIVGWIKGEKGVLDVGSSQPMFQQEVIASARRTKTVTMSNDPEGA